MRYGSIVVLMIVVLCSDVTIAHEWMAPAEEAARKNPVPRSAEAVAHGKTLYGDHCAYCHGDNLQGMSSDEAGLEQAPTNLRKNILNHSDGDFFWKISNGRKEMPSFQDQLSAEEIWQIIHYIRSTLP